MAKAALPHLYGKSSLLTMSYLGAVRTMPHYNVMGIAKTSLETCVRYLVTELERKGIRTNAISAGPIRILAAEVGNVAVFLCSDLASGITGEITHVDAGFNTISLGSTDLIIRFRIRKRRSMSGVFIDAASAAARVLRVGGTNG